MPLREEEEPEVDSNGVMQQVYQPAALDFAIAYGQQPNTLLEPEDWKWVQTSVRR